MDMGRSKWQELSSSILTCLDDHNPSLLIPLGHYLDFVLVFDTHVSVLQRRAFGRTWTETP